MRRWRDWMESLGLEILDLVERQAELIKKLTLKVAEQEALINELMGR